jgi:hypothetical protein
MVMISGVVWHEGDTVQWDEGMLTYRGYIEEINEAQKIMFLAVSEVKVKDPNTLIPMPLHYTNISLTRVE